MVISPELQFLGSQFVSSNTCRGRCARRDVHSTAVSEEWFFATRRKGADSMKNF